MPFCNLISHPTKIINAFHKFFQEIPSICQTVWIQIRPKALSALIYEEELNLEHLQNISSADPENSVGRVPTTVF